VDDFADNIQILVFLGVHYGFLGDLFKPIYWQWIYLEPSLRVFCLGII
jgi:hypothetical protein